MGPQVSTFASFLEEDGILDDVDAAAMKRVIAWRIGQAMEEKHIAKKKLAQDIGASRSQLDRLLDPENTSIQSTTTRAARAVGLRLRIELDRVPEGV